MANKNKSYLVDAEQVLLICDIHQDTSWATAVLEKEKGNYDHIIFNGDWFDTHKTTSISGITETAKLLKSCIDGKYGPATFILGNHDAPYLEAHKSSVVYKKPTHLNTFCPGFTNSKSLKVSKVLSQEDWRKFSMFCEFGHYIISHAGICSPFWSEYKSVDENLDKIWAETEEAIQLISLKPSKYLSPGLSRGGIETVGGLNWADWDCDFLDNLPIRQIVGHTMKYNTVRKTGMSYCVDGAQTTYCMLSKNGDIGFKSSVQDPFHRDDTEFKNKISENYRYYYENHWITWAKTSG